MRYLLLLLLTGCAAAPQPLDLPADPAADGVPVGVRTVVTSSFTVEVWYPAPDGTEASDETLDVNAYVPQAFADAVTAPVEFPRIPLRATRDADVRPGPEPYPVLFFSHGMGGFREQSFDQTTHLASRGYVVVAADHPGRMLGDILPCVFSPALDGCNLDGFGGDDPAVGDILNMLAWIDGEAEDGWLAGHIDTGRMGLFGHSAGGATTATMGDRSDRFDALLVEAVGRAAMADVPQQMMVGSCDFVADGAEATEASQGAPQTDVVELIGAGHMAFSDLCALDFLGLARTHLEGRDDLNDFVLDGLIDLATSGCPETPLPDATEFPDCADGYLPLDESTPLIRRYATTFFDAALRGEGQAIPTGVSDRVRVNP